MTDDCIFCKIVAGDIPSQQLHQDELVTAFRDISPQAPVHVLIIPNQHFASLAEMGDQQADVLGRIVQVAGQIAEQEGIADSGWRFISNVGPDGGQVVFHTHFHLLGGKSIGRMVAG